MMFNLQVLLPQKNKLTYEVKKRGGYDINLLLHRLPVKTDRREEN
jgi:hypothetical protein